MPSLAQRWSGPKSINVESQNAVDMHSDRGPVKNLLRVSAATFVVLSLSTIAVIGAPTSGASSKHAFASSVVPTQVTFQSEVASVFKRLKFPDPAGISCAMPQKWTTGTTFFCSVPGVDLQGAPARVRAVVTSSAVTLALPLKIAQQCDADSATVRVAVAAFQSQHPHVAVTKQALLGKAFGGPYLIGWPKGPPHYSISVTKNGGVMFAIPSGTTPKPWTKWICLSVLTVFAQLPR